MPLSRLTRTTGSGRPLFAVPSLNTLTTLGPEQVEILRTALRIRSLSDLLHYTPIHDARLLRTLSSGEIAQDFDVSPFIRVPAGAAPPRQDELERLPVERLARLDPADAAVWRDRLGVPTIGLLAEFRPFVEAQAFLDDDPFDEAPSAPQDLIPQATGSISNISRYTAFVRDAVFDVSAAGLRLFVDGDRLDFLDPRLLVLFQVDRQPRIGLGYAAQYKQKWINLGTALGEPVKSIGLAPGEVRKIAVVDWQRRTSGSRTEDTTASEQLSNQLIHNRALDEVTRATAVEHQHGGSGIAAGTLATAAGGVVASAVAGAAAIGIPAALVGALVGTAAEPGGGTAAGALIGLAAGGLAGGIGGAVLAAGNAQLGIVESDTSGSRDVAAQTAQRISDVTSQKASSVRSLWSTVVLTEQQAEQANVETIAIANYNHAHALTIQYFEVLQHYHSVVELASHQPYLYLPYKPILFDLELVTAYWQSLRLGIRDSQLLDRYDALVAGFDPTTQSPVPPADTFDGLRVAHVTVLAQPPRQFSSVRLRSSNSALANLAFESANPWELEIPADQRPAITAVQGVIFQNPFSGADLFGGITVAVTVRIDVVDDDGHTWTVERRQTLPPNGRIDFDIRERLTALAAEQNEDSSVLGELEGLVKRINDRRYLFTRLLLLGMEPEQLTDLVEALMFAAGTGTAVGSKPPPGFFGTGGAKGTRFFQSIRTAARDSSLPLSAFVEPTPIAITGDTLVFRMKRIQPRTGTTGSIVTDVHSVIANSFRALVPLRDYPPALAADLAAKRVQVGDDIFLPTGGLFAEGILGRAISAERLDGSRNIFWHELPIPHAPAEIQPVSATLSQALGPTPTPSDTSPTLTPAAPTPLPDPGLAAGVLAALGNGNLFRDMSKTEVLAGVLGNLSSLAGSMANQAGTLAGAAQSQALTQASQLAGKIADLTNQLLLAQQQSKAAAPATSTEKGITQNTVRDLAQDPPPAQPLNPNARAIARAQGADLPPATEPPLFIGGPQPAGGFPQRAEGGGASTGADTGSQRLDQGAAPSPSVFDIRDRFDGISNPGQTAKAIIRDIVNNAAQSGTAVPDVSNILVEWYDLGVRPALQAATTDDSKLDDALREFFDFLAQGEQFASEAAGAAGSDLGRRVAEGFRIGKTALTNGVGQANGRLAAATDLRELTRIDRLLSAARSDDRFQAEDNLGLGADLANLKVKAVVSDESISATVDPGGTADLALKVGYSINGGATKFDPPFNVSLASFEIEEPAPSGTTDRTDGRFGRTVRMLPHDPNRTGVISTRGNDLRLVVNAVSQVSALLSVSVTLVSRGTYTVRALGGRLDTDPLTGPRRTTLVASHNQDVLIDFSVAKGPDFIQGQPVSFTVVGAGTIAPASAVTGPDGLVQVVYTAPASASGNDTVRISVTDGAVNGTAQIDVRFS